MEFILVCLFEKEREKQNTSRLIREVIISPLANSPKPRNKIQKTNLNRVNLNLERGGENSYPFVCFILLVNTFLLVFVNILSSGFGEFKTGLLKTIQRTSNT